MSAQHSNFSIDLCSFGHDCGTCFYACMCPQCAIASARSKLDDSTCCFNLLCVGAAPSRWMVRTAYGIDGSAWGDIFSTACCLPCAANQMLHTVNEYPKIPYTETRDMYKSWDTSAGQCTCSTCMYAFCCSQCAVASAASTGTGMPWCFAFCCMNMCSARNMIRRHYRIRGGDMVEECLTPSCVYCFGSALILCGIGICVTPCTVAGCTAFLAQMVEQAERTPMPPPGTGYLSNYQPPNTGGSGCAPVTSQPNGQQPQVQYQPQMQYRSQAPAANTPVAAEAQMSPQQGYSPVNAYGAPAGHYPPPNGGSNYAQTAMAQAIVVSPSAPEEEELPPPPYSATHDTSGAVDKTQI